MRFYTNRFCVYAHYVASEDRCLYVGQGYAKRALDCSRRGRLWDSFLRKNNFLLTVHILGWFVFEKDARELERQSIKTLKPLCNKLHNGYHVSAKKRALLSKALTGRIITKETRQKMRDGYVYHCWNRGVPCRPETKQKISNGNRGKVRTKEMRQRTGLASKKAWALRKKKFGPSGRP